MEIFFSTAIVWAMCQGMNFFKITKLTVLEKPNWIDFIKLPIFIRWTAKISHIHFGRPYHFYETPIRKRVFSHYGEEIRQQWQELYHMPQFSFQLMNNGLRSYVSTKIKGENTLIHSDNAIQNQCILEHFLL